MKVLLVVLLLLAVALFLWLLWLIGKKLYSLFAGASTELSQ